MSLSRWEHLIVKWIVRRAIPVLMIVQVFLTGHL